MERTIKYIVVHCSGNTANSKITAKDIKDFHVKKRGFSDIGYHYVVRTDGVVELGRPCNVPGAHVKGHNKYSIGVCYVGGIDIHGKPADTRNEIQKKALDKLITDLHFSFPDALICGHRDFSKDLNGDGIISPEEWIKSCPCFDAKKEYERYNKNAKYTL